MSRKSRLVSTNTKLAASTTTAGGRSRGTCTGALANSAAIEACTAAIFAASEPTHCKPELEATCAKSVIGNVYDVTDGMLAASAGAGAVTGAVVSKDHRGRGALVGGAVGAAGGYALGKHNDKRKGRRVVRKH